MPHRGIEPASAACRSGALPPELHLRYFTIARAVVRNPAIHAVLNYERIKTITVITIIIIIVIGRSHYLSCRLNTLLPFCCCCSCLTAVYTCVPTGSPSRGGDVAIDVFNMNQPSLPTPFILFLCLFLLSLWPFQLYFIALM